MCNSYVMLAFCKLLISSYTIFQCNDFVYITENKCYVLLLYEWIQVLPQDYIIWLKLYSWRYQTFTTLEVVFRFIMLSCTIIDINGSAVSVMPTMFPAFKVAKWTKVVSYQKLWNANVWRDQKSPKRNVCWQQFRCRRNKLYSAVAVHNLYIWLLFMLRLVNSNHVDALLIINKNLLRQTPVAGYMLLSEYLCIELTLKPVVILWYVSMF